MTEGSHRRIAKGAIAAAGLGWHAVALIIFITSLLFTAAFYLDAGVQNWVSENRNTTVETFMRAVSRYGDWPTHLVLGLLLGGIAYLRGSRRWLWIFVAMLVACALAGMTTRIIKMSVGRARPHVKTEIRWAGPTFSAKHHAFPSGHSSSSSAFFATLLFASWRAGIACLPIPLLIGFSRIYIGAHHLSDVMFGFLVGASTAVLVAVVLLPRVMREEPPTFLKEG